MTSPEAVVLTFLANAAWQASLLAGAAWAGAWLLRGAPAAYRHRLWMVALAVSVVSPAASALRPPPQHGADVAATNRGFPIAEPDVREKTAASGPRLALPIHHPLGRLGRALAVAYLLVLLARSIRLARAWRRSVELVGRAEVAPHSLAGTIAGCASWLGPGPVIRLSAEVATPMTFGLRRPVVLLPEHFASAAAPESMRGALAHERAHVARHDCAWNLACELAALPLWFHPAVRFVKRRVVGAREAACDEAAAAFVGAPCYARTLLEVASLARRPARLAGALGVLDGDTLEDRMKKILSGGRSMDGRKATLVLCAVLLALASAGRWAAAAAVAVTAEAGPSDMVGRWTAAMPGDSPTGRPAAELTIALTPNGPDIALTLYRYPANAEEGEPVVEHPPVVQHSVEDGVLRFRTRVEDFRARAADPPAPMEADWKFAVVGADAGELSLVRNSVLDRDKSQGRAVPPPPPALPMKRTSKP